MRLLHDDGRLHHAQPAGPPVEVVVLNNGTLGFVEMEMKAGGFIDTDVALKNPNFASMMGIKGIRVEDPYVLKAGLQEAFQHDGPVLVDVVSGRQVLVLPPKTTFEQAAHFGLFTLKAVLGGRAGGRIDRSRERAASPLGAGWSPFLKGARRWICGALQALLSRAQKFAFR